MNVVRYGARPNVGPSAVAWDLMEKKYGKFSNMSLHIPCGKSSYWFATINGTTEIVTSKEVLDFMRIGKK